MKRSLNSFRAERLIELVETAVNRRAPLIGQYEAFRLVDGRGDGLPDIYFDRYGEVGLAHLLGQEATQMMHSNGMRQAAAELARVANLKAIYLRRHSPKARQTAQGQADLILGRPREEVAIHEHGVTYLVHPASQVNAGLFLDTRVLRGQIKEAARGLRVLNTFCFTGSLGLAAYAGRAREVMQVDISKAALSSARENERRNWPNSDAERQVRYIPEDSLKFMQREARRLEKGGERYGLVIVDPPAFGSSNGNTFSFKRDIEKVVRAGLELVAHPGQLILTCNVSDYSAAQLEGLVRELAKSSARQVVHATRLHPPGDDFTSRERDSIAMRGVWVRM